jgi:hypothetical protein
MIYPFIWTSDIHERELEIFGTDNTHRIWATTWDAQACCMFRSAEPLSRSAPATLCLFRPLPFDPADLEREQHESRVITMDFMRGAEFRCFARGRQVRPQALKPLVADGVGRIPIAWAASPLPVGVPSIRQPAPPVLDRFVALRVQLHFDLVLVVGVRDHSREKRVGDGPRNARHAHGGRPDDRTQEAHHCPVHAQIVAFKSVRQQIDDAFSAIR